jgi:hypothetical protein
MRDFGGLLLQLIDSLHNMPGNNSTQANDTGIFDNLMKERAP